ncbi:MAG: nucleoside hydrolase [Streptosporangiales bacterium]|nr:nucleoside hydrolase [Streptosporangiales bacterium]
MRCVLDCDPGHDDAVAILLAAKHLEVVGITTVSGNQSLAKVTHNARAVLELGGLTDIPVAAGMSRPMVADPVHAPEIHGESGLDGAELPEPTVPVVPEHAVQFILDASRRYDDLWLLAVGPLTNVAVALVQDPGLAQRIAGISLMGGSLTFGNSTPAAEFNIWCDPEAADVVFRSGIPIRMFGLNVTRQVGAGHPEIDRIRALGSPPARTVADLLAAYRGNLERALGVTTASLHDPLAAAWLVDPALCELQAMHVGVELTGTHTRGMTVCDYRHTADGAPPDAAVRPRGELNAEVAVTVDAPAFFDLLTETLAAY